MWEPAPLFSRDAGRQLHRHNCFRGLVDLLVGGVKWRNTVWHCCKTAELWSNILTGFFISFPGKVLQMPFLVSFQRMPRETLRVSWEVENNAVSLHTVLSV